MLFDNQFQSHHVSLLAAMFLVAVTLGGCSTRMQGAMALGSEPQRAVELYRQALAENPDSARTRIQLGKALVQHGLYDEARQRLTEALNVLPDDPEAQLYRDLSELGSSGQSGALGRLMAYAPYQKQKLAIVVRTEAARLRIRSDLSDTDVIRRMEKAYRRGMQEEKKIERRSLNGFAD